MPTTPDRRALRPIIGACIVAAYGAAAAVLVATGTSRIRYSADHDRTIGLWEIWIPVAAGAHRGPGRPAPPPIAPSWARRRPTSPRSLGVRCHRGHVRGGVVSFEAGYLALKIGLIGIAPTLVLTHRAWLTGFPQQGAYRHWWWAGPAAATTAWLSIAWIGPYARSTTADATVVTLIAGFVLNAYLEERFYRGWLQTRLEHVWGRWIAIGAASLLWAAWHVAIHTTGRPLVDVATAISHIGVLGLLLGYLWARFRNPWALLVVHAAINAPVALITTAWT